MRQYLAIRAVIGRLLQKFLYIYDELVDVFSQYFYAVKLPRYVKLFAKKDKRKLTKEVLPSLVSFLI